MACRKLLTRKYKAQLADKPAPCAFCSVKIDEEITYGKLYSIGDIHCHYFCVLLSCCLIQNGKDDEGLFGFLYPDILAEIERSKKHRCSYCNKDGAALGCSVKQCRKQFHLPCGRMKNAVSLFYDNYKSYCKDHAPKQNIPKTIISKAKARQAKANRILKHKSETYKEDDTDVQEAECVCVICYERVDGFPKVDTFWPPCCARDAWFHRNCIERMALNAGVHYLKCPLCNDKDKFYKAVLQQGYYVPDRDAAWELEQNAYSEIYERPSVCSVEVCNCPNGREFDDDTGDWAIKLCLLCGSGGAHRGCSSKEYHLCVLCEKIAPSAEQLAELQRVSLPTQNQTRTRSGPVMPCRMSIRRTKARSQYRSSSSQSNFNTDSAKTLEESRRELNLSTPKRQTRADNTSNTQNIHLISPMKLIEREIHAKCTSRGIVVDFDKVLVEVRSKFQKPRPLVEKRKIVNNILQELLNNKTLENKSKEPIKEWNSPKKSSKEYIEENQQEISALEGNPETINIDTDNIKEEPLELSTPTKNETIETPKLKEVNIQNDSMEISENDQTINIDLVNIKSDGSLSIVGKNKCVKFSPFSEIVLDKNIDIESFKNQYLNEVDRQFNPKFKQTVTFDTAKIPPKRNLPPDNVASKKRKTTKMVKKKFRNTEVSIRNRNINLKIKWKNDELNLKITDLKKKKRKNRKETKQYILSSKMSIAKPEHDVVLIKKKHAKLQKSPDKLKQTSISSFFKVQQPDAKEK